MTQRTTHALQAAFVFAVVLSLFFITGLGTISRFVNTLSLWAGAAWHFSVAFWAAFSVWWLVFRTPKVGLWHATYVGYAFILLCHLATPLLLSAVLGLEWLEQLMNALPQYLLGSLPVSLPFMALSLALRWWQLRGAEKQAS